MRCYSFIRSCIFVDSESEITLGCGDNHSTKRSADPVCVISFCKHGEPATVAPGKISRFIAKQALVELICDWNTLIVKTILDLTCMINVHVLYFHDNLIWLMDYSKIPGIAILIGQIFLLTVKMIALYSCGKLLIDALIFFYTSILKLQFLLENNYSRKYPWHWCTVK